MQVQEGKKEKYKTQLQTPGVLHYITYLGPKLLKGSQINKCLSISTLIIYHCCLFKRSTQAKPQLQRGILF